MKLKTIIISLISIFVVGITSVLLYCYWPAIKGTVDDSKYYTAEELQESYDKGYDDGCKSETELTGQVKYYKDLVDEYYIQVNTLNDEISLLSNNNNDYKTQISNLKIQKSSLEDNVSELQSIKKSNENTITDLNSQIASLQKEVNTLTDSDEDKSEQINSLNSQIVTLQSTVSQLQKTNDMNVNTITSLNVQISNLNSQISEMTTQSQNSSSQINVLNNRINELQSSINYYESYISSLENGDQVVVTFEFDGSVYNIQIINKGSKVSVNNPTSTDYVVFNYWTLDNEKIDLDTYTFTSNKKLVADVTYKYDVKFMVDSTLYNSQIVALNSYASLPSNPTKDGYDFDGWSLNGVDVLDNINSTLVTSNTTYTAVFTKVHTVSFMVEDEVVEIQRIRNGNNVSIPDSPTKDGFDFLGWSQDGENFVDLNNILIYSNTTFFAIFNECEAILLSGSKVKDAIGSSVTDVVFDYYTDKTLKNYIVNGINVIDGVSSKNLSEENSPSTIELYLKNKKAYILSSAKIKAIDTNNMFYYLTSIRSISFNNFDTSSVTDMTSMFVGLYNLETLDLSSFDTHNVDSFHWFLYGCTSLKSINLSSFDTSNVTTMCYMFRDCYKLEKLDLSSFDTGNVTNMYCMFKDCRSLTSIELSSFDTCNVEMMSYMFSGCSSLTNLNLSNFDASNVTSIDEMFYGCESLVSIDLSNFNNCKISSMSQLFYGCKSLINLDLSSFYTSNVTNMSCMFMGCSSLTSIDLSGFDTSSVEAMASMFSGCESLMSIDLSNFDTSNVENMYEMFRGCKLLSTIFVSDLWSVDAVISDYNMFYLCSNLPNFTFNDYDSTFAHYGEGGYLTYKES